jgi:hypothetical protein
MHFYRFRAYLALGTSTEVHEQQLVRVGVTLRSLTELLGVLECQFVQLKDRSNARQGLAVRIGQVKPEELITSTQFP